MGSEQSREEEKQADAAELAEFDRVSTAAPNPQLGGGKKRTRNYTMKSKQKRRQSRRQK